MNRRSLLSTMLAGGALVIMPGGIVAANDVKYFHDVAVSASALEPLEREAAWWKERVAGDAWRILFREETERAGTSPLDRIYENGTYICAACHLPLFSSDAKFDSGTGWPSFWAGYDKHIGTRTDYKLIWPRTEYHCARCGGHQGHVFDDGPRPTGKRFCNNGLALTFIPESEVLPALRG